MTVPYQSKKILRFGTQVKLSKNVLHDGRMGGGSPLPADAGVTKYSKQA